ncbi:MAG: helix-turn-helix domain-containing protein [Prevotellaceae bacterium]|nr:helix-turn-helix domain-containing protein [Prevotellaceae bacterium]
MEERIIVARNLKALRQANGYTQEQVAAFLGIHRSAYANYESGEREAPIELLEKASELMGCELGVLFDEDEKAVRDMLVCAFRADNLCPSDLIEVAAFKNIVLNYMKMKRLLAQ